MKLWIDRNNVQMLLNSDEIDRLITGKRVEERLEIGPQPLVYTLEAEEDAPGIGASLLHGHFKVIVPRQQARQWAVSDELHLDAQQPTGPGPAIHVHIEKDMIGTQPPAKAHGDVLREAVRSMDFHSGDSSPAAPR